MRIKSIIEEFLSPQFVWFFAAACLSAAVNFCARYALDPLLGYSAAIVLAYLIGMAVSFLLYQRRVFASSGKALGQELSWFLLINIAGLLQTLVFSVAIYQWCMPLVGWQWHGKEIAHLIGMAIPMFSSFLGHKYLTFKQQQIPAE